MKTIHKISAACEETGLVIACSVMHGEKYEYVERVGDLMTTYDADTLEELRSKVDHMLLASHVVSGAMDVIA